MSLRVLNGHLILLIQIEVLPEFALDEQFYIKFAQFEERQKEFDRFVYSNSQK